MKIIPSRTSAGTRPRTRTRTRIGTGTVARRRMPTLLRLSACLCVCLLAACASAPAVRFHSLLPVDAPERDASAGAGFVVTLGPLAVPSQVDQPQWLLRAADGSLTLLEQERWASPLRSELRAALLDRWISRWGATEASAAPAASAVAASSFIGGRVLVDVTRFESLPGGETRLEGRWSARSGAPGATALSCRFVMRESVGDGMLALADGHRRAVSRLADEMARPLSALQRGESPGCPPAG